MDPLTQGLLGAVASQALFAKRLGRTAWLAGALGGVLPDADILIRSSSDPLLAIEYHRQFTHSLAFIPFGGAVAALPLMARAENRRRWSLVLAAAVAGYATHGLLDACTTYGTQLLWPFSNVRVAWDSISIIDPIFTLVLLIGAIVSSRRNSPRPAAAALAICLTYIAAGVVQRNRAAEVQMELARSRGHQVLRGEVFPTVGNNIVWRSLYLADGMLHADRIRVPWWGEWSLNEGTSVALMTASDLPRSVVADPRLMRDFERFRWFSDGWIARAPDEPDVIGDVRYSLRTDAFDPIWGIRFQPGSNPPVEWVDRTRSRDVEPADFWRELAGKKLKG